MPTESHSNHWSFCGLPHHKLLFIQLWIMPGKNIYSKSLNIWWKIMNKRFKQMSHNRSLFPKVWAITPCGVWRTNNGSWKMNTLKWVLVVQQKKTIFLLMQQALVFKVWEAIWYIMVWAECFYQPMVQGSCFHKSFRQFFYVMEALVTTD